MKKILLVLTMMFISLSLGACGNVIDETSQTSQTPLSVDIPNGEVTEDGIQVWEIDRYSVTIDDIEPNAENGFDIEIIFENKTNREASIDLTDITVNDIDMVYTVTFNERIRAGQTKHMMLTIPSELFGESDDVLLTDIELSFMAYDELDETSYLVGPVTIYPYGEELSGTYDTKNLPCVVELLNTDVALAKLVGYNFNKSVGGFYANVYVYNRSHGDVEVMHEAVVINSYSILSVSVADVEAYTGAIISLYVSESDLYEIGVNSVEDITDIFIEGEIIKY